MTEAKKPLGSLLLAVVLSGLATGCTNVTTTPSVAGRTFVVHSGLFSSTYWNCDATGDTPVCYQTKKKPLEEK